jgi:hypothetical protein
MTTRGNYAAAARELTSVLTSTELSTTVILTFVQEAVNELYRKHGTGWGFALTPLTSDGATTAFEDQFDGAVVYRVASKILKQINDTTGRSDFYLQEAALIVADMEKYYLSANANPGNLNGIQSLSSLSNAVRTITGVYDPQVLSASMLRELVNVAYSELLNYRDWNNWRSYYQDSLPAWTLAGYTTYAVSSHQITLRADVFGHLPGAGSSTGIRGVLVKEAYLVTGGFSGRMQRMIRTDSLADVHENSDQVYYTLEIDHESNEVRMFIAPEQETNETSVRWVASNPVTRIDSYSQQVYDPETDTTSTVTTSTFFEVPPQFNMLPVYRAAQLALQQVAPEDPRIESYGDTYASLLDAFVSFDQLNHDTASFSIGQQGKDNPRYVPWFKPA